MRASLNNFRGLRALTLLATTLFLVASCSSAASPSPSATGTATPPPTGTAPPTPGETPTPAPSVGGELAYLGFQGDDAPTTMKSFYDETGITLGATYVDSSEDIVTKLKAGGLGKYDFGTANQRLVQTLVDEDLIVPIDESQVPNLEQLFPELRDASVVPWAWRDGKLYAIPAYFGFDAINYNADAIPVAPTNWDELLDASYKGKICVLDNPVGQILSVGEHLGFGSDGTTFTKEKLTQIVDWIKKLVANSKTFVKGYGEMADLMIRGDCTVGWIGWEYVSVKGQDAGVNIRHFIEQGKVKAWADALVVFKGAQNPAAAYAWINRLLDAKVMAGAAQEVSSLVTNTQVVDYLPKEFVDQMDFAAAAQKLKDIAWSTKPPATSTDPNQATLEDFTKAWEEIKASAGG